MSYTNIDLVKRHIGFNDIPAGLKQNYKVTFTGPDLIDLPGNKIFNSSVAVKVVKQLKPTLELKTVGSSPISLANTRVVSGSITVAGDSSLGVIYTENVDYFLDAINNTVVVIDDGDINEGDEIAIWYYYHTTYSEGVDYSIDYHEGTIRRLSGGSIQIGQSVLVDYQLSDNHLNDDIITEAVAEANALVENEADQEKIMGADLTLQTAATYLAVSLLCRIAAAGDLGQSGQGSKTALSWLALADSYRLDYTGLMKTFRPVVARMNRPTHS